MAGTTDAQALLLTVSADTSKALKAVEALNKRLEGLAPEMTRHAKRAAEGIEKELGGIKFGEAGKKIFDSARFATLEEGGAKLRIFGSALEPLGGLGIAAAAGVVALSEALAQAHEAIEYADGLYKAAAAAHVSTDALQEYRAAVIKAGGDANEAGPALLQFSETLGKAAEGLKGLRPFQALFGKGFGVGDVKALGGTDKALDAVVAKIQNLSSRSQQDAAISQFGLQGLAPLILAGADAWKAYREEAKGAGLVLDAEVIKRGHELNVQMDELTGKIKNELTTAFINLGPVLVGILGLVDKMLTGINKFSGELARNPLIQDLIGTSLGPGAMDAVRKYGLSQVAEVGAPTTISPAALKAALASKTGTGHLSDLTNTGSDQTGEFDKAASDALDSSREALARAQAALITGILEHAEAEKAAVDAALTKKLHDNALEAEKIGKAKNDADKVAQLAKLGSAKVAEQQAAEAQKQLIDQQAASKALEEFVAYADKIRSDYARIAANSAHMATTLADRNAIETRETARAQQRELADFDLRAQNSLVGKGGPDLEAQVNRNDAERNALVDRQKSDAAAKAFDQAGPIEAYARSIQDLNTAVQEDAVGAFRDLTSGLVDAALHAKSLGDVAKNVFLNLIQQILTQTLQKEALPGLEAAGSALLHFIPGHASGSDSFGGLTKLNERGPEGVAFLPPGTKIIPNDTLRALSRMKVSSRGGAVIVQQFHLHAEGALMTEEFARNLDMRAQQHAAQAGQAGRRAAVADVQRAGYAANINQ